VNCLYNDESSFHIRTIYSTEDQADVNAYCRTVTEKLVFIIFTKGTIVSLCASYKYIYILHGKMIICNKLHFKKNLQCPQKAFGSSKLCSFKKYVNIWSGHKYHVFPSSCLLGSGNPSMSMLKIGLSLPILRRRWRCQMYDVYWLPDGCFLWSRGIKIL
jgi:hypothetical protein